MIFIDWANCAEDFRHVETPAAAYLKRSIFQGYQLYDTY
jgi:hypothetical protein